MAKTRANLVEMVARRFGNYASGTATSGSTSTIVDAANLMEPDDFWIGHYAYITEDAGGAGAAPEGQERPVTDYDQSTGTLTVSPVFTAAVAASDTFEVLPMRRADIVEAINAGIREMGELWMVLTKDTTTITLASGDYDYTLPTDVVRLLKVVYRDESDEAWVEIPGNLWRVAGTPGAQELLLDRLDMVDAGDTLRLEYLKRVAEMDDDADTLGLGEPAEREAVAFVVAWALRWLYLRASQGGHTRVYLTLAQMVEKEAEGIRQRAAPPSGGRTGMVRTERWGRTAF